MGHITFINFGKGAFAFVGGYGQSKELKTAQPVYTI